MSFRTSLLRAPLPRARTPLLSISARQLTTQSARPLRTLPQAYTNVLGRRGLNTSQTVNLEASRALADGGMEEAPHSGINVDKPTRMDT
ncbi:hypothetical protein I302_104985 [Kwoniella bestiolae CBS 10118]|uniref:Uncharacterized protein n=1 Tax=Kwoniella bestiolae CBS 10118 TaxID=1296100 RepID=A0A1B9FR79_9TREE|nr:hypothetical protein I302_08943 [Kwoniella bestiolae CBS 10118]OCF21271.1 hypothetical protein I302_08943 [Kwoniella bestiolae CBS 10118]